ncbi:flagellar basal body P-ring formation chaperone FlgA [Paragemmobacter straminiformis]|uniref:flagellar basal body P-ring formation chaperone FlgA n=1 Tax=Paragemmobacter straminiformis TaxID=2045119 RepID=UPI0030CA51E0
MLRWPLVLVLTALPAGAGGWPEGIPGAEVGRMVREAMVAAGQAVPGFADPVRRFPPCAAAPAVSPRAGSWATADLRCAAPVWLRSVRTGAQPAARAKPDAPEAALGPKVVTLTHSLARGAMIGAGDIGLAPMPERAVDGIFTDPAMVIGRRAKVGLGEGQPVLARQLEPVWLVEKGNPLSLTASAGGLSVSAPAEALENGALGDVIRVMNLSSRREVKALVTGPNIVTAQTNMR